MANSEYNYIPTYIRRIINNRPKDVVTAKYWNELFNLLITQGDHTAEELGNILNHFSTRLVGVESEIAESAEAIANIRGVLRINVTYSNGVYSADKTFDEIKAAYDAGQQPYVVETGGTFDLVYTLANFEAPTDGSEPKFVDFKRYLVGDGILETEMLRIYSYTTDSGSNVVKRIDEFKMPTSLKNPNALTFTGGATGSYDGSTAKTVNIPSAVTDDHINSLIDTKLEKLEVVESGTTYVKVNSTGDVISTVNGETYADIQALINAGKPVAVRYNDISDFYYFEALGFSNSSGLHRRLNFRCVMDSSVYTLTLRDDNTWVFSQTNLQTSSITDSGGHFTTDTVEGALQEIGAELAGINTLLGSGIQISFTIDGDPFSAVSGETWKEWIGGYSRVISEISGLTLYCSSDDGIILADEAGVNALGLNDVWVHGNETIVSGATYAIIPCGG